MKMPVSVFVRLWLIALSVAWFALQINSVHAQQQGGTPQTDKGEGIAVDAAGNVFTAEAQLRGVTKYARDQ
jgi:hypothetical protein